MNLKLTDLIEQAALGGAMEEDFPEEKTASAKPLAPTPMNLQDFGDIEKLASTLEFLGNRGVSRLLKVANHEMGTSHPALATSESAIAYTKKEKAKRTTPAIKKCLTTTPYKDNKLKQLLSSAGAKGDKNIHSKVAHDLSAIQQELAQRRARGES